MQNAQTKKITYWQQFNNRDFKLILNLFAFINSCLAWWEVDCIFLKMVVFYIDLKFSI